jgi:hypothetical protein
MDWTKSKKALTRPADEGLCVDASALRYPPGDWPRMLKVKKIAKTEKVWDMAEKSLP